MALKMELIAQYKDVEVLTLERELSNRAAETASKQHLESTRKVGKLEAECLRLKSLNNRLRSVTNPNPLSNSACIDSLTRNSDNGERLHLGANAFISELDRFKHTDSARNLTEIDLMDDFLEMESYTKTFDGIDAAGKRLAEEVLCVVKKTISLKRISFLAHSLGGLFARYAVAVLYASDTQTKDANENPTEGKDNEPGIPGKLGTIAGLEPVNFITLASPHLGVRGKRQLPFLFGLSVLEKLAPSLAPILVGRTGHQLFLTDGKPSNPPLLLRMASDSEDLKFLSALAAFKTRIIYANVSYDHMVGWRTSSIRRETEIYKPSLSSLDGYKHVVGVEYCPPVVSEGPHYRSEAAKGKEAAQTDPNTQDTADYYDMMEEEMIRGLQRLGWVKVDVSFHSALVPFFAHNSIHVKNEWLYNAGAGVIAHVADNIKQQEPSSNIAASLTH